MPLPEPPTEHAPRPRLRHVGWSLAGNVIYSACQWGVLVALAKLGDPVAVGRFALGLAVAAPILTLSQMQLRGIQATDAREEHPFGVYLALRLLTSAVALLVILGVAGFGRFARDTAVVLAVIGVAKGMDAVSDVYYGHWQRRYCFRRVAVVQVTNGLVTLAAVSGLMAVTGQVAWAAFGSALGSAAALGYAGWLERRVRLQWRRPALLRLARLAWPLGVVTMLGAANANAPRYFVAGWLGERELGVFAALTYLTVVGSTVVMAIGQAASPGLAEHYARGETRAFRAVVLRMALGGIALGAVGVVAAVFAGRWILSAFYEPEYGAAAPALTWTMASAGVLFVASFLGYALTAARRFAVQMPVAAASLIANAAGCPLLVRSLGLRGAAAAMGISAAVQCAAMGFALSRALREREGVAP
ncbi:MAG TPA: lipopolysaccharide biosynthesis protein [Armatimonadota bacterium]